MKIAITATKPQFDATFDQRFGRCAYFIVIERDSRAWQSLTNPAAEARGGAGTLAAQFVAQQGVQAVVSGKFGPNAYTALQTAGIRMVEAQGGNVETLLDAFLAGELREVTSPTAAGKHGSGRRGR